MSTMVNISFTEIKYSYIFILETTSPYFNIFKGRLRFFCNLPSKIVKNIGACLYREAGLHDGGQKQIKTEPVFKIKKCRKESTK